MAHEEEENLPKPNEEPDFAKLELELGISPMDQDATQMHEIFKSLLRAGFKERQALRLVALIITEHDILEDAVVFQYDFDDEDDISDLDFDADDSEE